jgi:hypothetical protein
MNRYFTPFNILNADPKGSASVNIIRQRYFSTDKTPLLYSIIKEFYRLKMCIIVIIFCIAILFTLHRFKEQFQTANIPIILLGDSILQNQSYVSRGNSVYELIKRNIPNTLCYASDGSLIIDVYRQLDKIGKTQKGIFILSIGGNDLLYRPTCIEEITIKYKELIEWIEEQFPNGKLYLLDIYFPQRIKENHDKIMQWNQFIYSLAREKELNVIKISRYLNESEDFTKCIEPSDNGSKKIARIILETIE